MHEISLCENIRDLIEDQARADGFTRVNKVWLEVGPLSCVEPEALRFGFRAVMAGLISTSRLGRRFPATTAGFRARPVQETSPINPQERT